MNGRRIAVSGHPVLVVCLLQVAQGFRRDIPQQWPDALKELVKACWEQAPEDRPTALEARP